MQLVESLYCTLLVACSLLVSFAFHDCYSKDQSHLEVVQLNIELSNTTSVAPYYYNLSCPWEMSKFSCVHQGQLHKASIALQYTQQAQGVDCKLRSFDGTELLRLLGNRSIVFAGDSIMRQMFLSMACMLYISPGVELVRDNVVWEVSAIMHNFKMLLLLFRSQLVPSFCSRTPCIAAQANWPCHGTSNCIEGGQHSGFSWGCITFSSDNNVTMLNMCVQQADEGIPIDEIAQHYGLVPAYDIIVANLGVHFMSQGRTAERLQQLRNVLQRYQNSAVPLPIVIYKETSPQHFPGHRGGMYEVALGQLYTSCVETVDILYDARSMSEREMLQGKMPFLAVNPTAASNGLLKVTTGVRGRTGDSVDCTHW
jgi:GDSL/SGNH-like Acyl-Esterase family found in Pmr5 and Cas1p